MPYASDACRSNADGPHPAAPPTTAAVTKASADRNADPIPGSLVVGHPGVVVYMVTCPVCRAERSHRCRGLQSHLSWRFPHWRRIAVAAARLLLRAAVSQDPLKFALAVEDAASTASAEPKQAGSADRRAALGDYDELAGYHSAGYLLGLADSILGRLDQRTLDLSPLSRGRRGAGTRDRPSRPGRLPPSPAVAVPVIPAQRRP